MRYLLKLTQHTLLTLVVFHWDFSNSWPELPEGNTGVPRTPTWSPKSVFCFSLDRIPLTSLQPLLSHHR